MSMMMFQEKTPLSIKALTSESKVQKTCSHCKTSFVARECDDLNFCCKGCESAWIFIHDLGLASFYEAAENTLLIPGKKSDQQKLDLFDNKAYQDTFTKAIEGQERLESRLFIDGITCYACIWLIQNAVERSFSNLEISVLVNQSTGSATIQWNSDHIKLSEIVKKIESLGYAVYPDRHTKLDSQAELIRVGVGLFIVINVMSFALVEYLAGSDGVDTILARVLRYLSFAMASISVFYVGQNLFQNSYRAIKAKSASIDFPILVGILLAFTWSAFNTLTNNGPVYFDSITAVIGLLITGRYIQYSVLKKNQSKLAAILDPKSGWALTSNDQTDDWQLKPITEIKAGDKIRILPGEMIPLQSSCLSSCGEISFEQLRGEVHWTSVLYNTTIPAGAVNGSTPMDLVANENGAASYTTQLMKTIEKALHDKGRWNEWSDRAAWVLFLAVSMIAVGVLIYFLNVNFVEGLRRAIALFLVACPCTFGIGVPLVYGNAVGLALKNGLLIKSQKSLENLSRIHALVFDKTGTLTQGSLEITDWTWNLTPSNRDQANELSFLLELPNHSSHHVIKALAKFAAENLGLTTTGITNLVSVKEYSGQGVEFIYGKKHVRIGRFSFAAITNDKNSQCKKFTSAISFNGILVASFNLKDKLLEEAKNCVDFLTKSHINLYILSGDSVWETTEIASKLKIPPEDTLAEATPASKAIFLQKLRKRNQIVAMVGNGLNDAAAMAYADVSIAVSNSSSTTVESADICILKPDLNIIETAYRLAVFCRSQIQTVFCFSTLYNLTGITLAVTGQMSPVLAAVLMPLSSITVTLIANRSLNLRYKEA